MNFRTKIMNNKVIRGKYIKNLIAKDLRGKRYDIERLGA